MYLTDKELQFTSHKMNFANEHLSIPLNEVNSVEPRRTMGFIPNGLLVKINAGQQYKFVVDDRMKWIQAIINQKKSNH